MAIQIEVLLEEVQGKTSALITHGSSKIHAYVNGQKKDLVDIVGSTIIVEMDYEKIISWNEVQCFNEEMSGIFPDSSIPNSVLIRGQVHNVIDIGNNEQLIDIYLFNGPEFLSVSSKEINSRVPKVGVGIEVLVENLCFYIGNI